LAIATSKAVKPLLFFKLTSQPFDTSEQ